jgi:hypothetical protein
VGTGTGNRPIALKQAGYASGITISDACISAQRCYLVTSLLSCEMPGKFDVCHG